jgi:Zn-dependent protease
MASRLGDQTARLEGRITLNPMYHVDPVGTLLFPALIIFGPFIGFTFFSGFLVGWAKPTPVITRNFRKIVRDDNLTTLAGPVSNMVLVLLAFSVLAIMAVALPDGREIVQASFIAALSPGAPVTIQPVALLCSLAVLINLSLFFFNLLPIPPLDGSHVVRNMLPYGAVQVYDQVGGVLSIILMMTLGGYLMNLFVSPFIEMLFNQLLSMQPMMLMQ